MMSLIYKIKGCSRDVCSSFYAWKFRFKVPLFECLKRCWWLIELWFRK